MLGQRTIIGMGMAGVLLLSAASISGCYGSTEPATNIDVDSATLNAYGDTEGSPTTSWFEYWRTSEPANVRTSGSHDLPAHVRGPFSARLNYPNDALDPITQYSFRLCGTTQGRAPVCAQTRTFRTLDGDVVTAGVVGGGVPARVRAVSGPNGEAPRGFFIVDGNMDPPQGEDAVCLSVHGSEAVVGFMGPSGGRRTLGLLAGTHPATMDVTRDPANCAGLRPSDLPPRDITATTQIHDGS